MEYGLKSQLSPFIKYLQNQNTLQKHTIIKVLFHSPTCLKVINIETDNFSWNYITPFLSTESFQIFLSMHNLDIAMFHE